MMSQDSSVRLLLLVRSVVVKESVCLLSDPITYSTNFVMPADKPEKIKVLMVCLG